jgi:hypothetical protein
MAGGAGIANFAAKRSHCCRDDSITATQGVEMNCNEADVGYFDETRKGASCRQRARARFGASVNSGLHFRRQCIDIPRIRAVIVRAQPASRRRAVQRAQGEQGCRHSGDQPRFAKPAHVAHLLSSKNFADATPSNRRSRSVSHPFAVTRTKVVWTDWAEHSHYFKRTVSTHFLTCFVFPDTLTEEFVVGLANPGSLLIIKEGQERVAAAARDA